MNLDQLNPDQRLHGALHDASQRFGPHSGDLVARAAARGRRLRLVRRAQLGAAAFVAAGVCVTGGVAFSGRPASVPAPAAPPTATAAPAPTQTQTQAPTRAPSASPPLGGPRSGPISAQLAAFLPPGKITRTNSNGTFVDGRITKPDTPNTGAGGGFTYDDGKGASVIQVDLGDHTRTEGSGCPPTSPGHCAETLPDGTKVWVDAGAIIGGGKRLTVIALRPDGRQVQVEEFNVASIVPSAGNATPAPTRPDLPLTVDQLRGIALSPHWNP
ncbi:hypothetical protein ACIPLC_07920 [Kitasatospora sp. NPDC086801]|uniref:hypothetical protein n=1 Tax=Kitasatospora sp. NPDC086801 TaxID=3364066 RepID=UPI0037FD6AE1